MNYNSVLKLLKKAQKGNEFARESLVKECRAFIYNIGCNISKRSLSWENDDELSIALIAFDEAISRYDAVKGASFLTFARKVIQQRLIDFFRKEERHHHIPLYESVGEDEKETSFIENAKALENYQLQSEQEDLAQTMLDFDSRLIEYSTSLNELSQICPKHSDTREKLLYVAEIVSSDQSLLETLRRTKRIPTKEIVKNTGVSRRVLENGRKYIIALVLILTEPRFEMMKSFTGLDDRERRAAK